LGQSDTRAPQHTTFRTFTALSLAWPNIRPQQNTFVTYASIRRPSRRTTRVYSAFGAECIALTHAVALTPVAAGAVDPAGWRLPAAAGFMCFCAFPSGSRVDFLMAT
jgi:hypothetical protein